MYTIQVKQYLMAECVKYKRLLKTQCTIVTMMNTGETSFYYPFGNHDSRFGF